MDKDWKYSKQAIRYLQVASQGTTGTKFGIVDCWSLKAKKVFLRDSSNCNKATQCSDVCVKSLQIFELLRIMQIAMYVYYVNK